MQNYWLKLHNFDSVVDVSFLNKLEADDIKNGYDLT